MTERSWVQTPALETIFHAPLIRIKTMNAKIVESVAFAVIPKMGG
jgi:hypothetical protein